MFGFFVPLEKFSLIRSRHHCRWRAANFDLSMAHMAIEQWGFLSVPHQLWHGATVCNGHLGDPRHSYIQPSVVSVEVTNCFYDLDLSRLEFEHPTFRFRGERSNTLRHRRGRVVVSYENYCLVWTCECWLLLPNV